MGKSAIALNIATNVALKGESVAIFSLEMSKEEIVQRILSSVGQVDSKKLRNGQLGPLWQRVVDAAGKMYKAPIFIDDSSMVTVTDIRAKCRRLKRKRGLSLVIVDYLQLLQASTRENRQQEDLRDHQESEEPGEGACGSDHRCFSDSTALWSPGRTDGLVSPTSGSRAPSSRTQTSSCSSIGTSTTTPRIRRRRASPS